MPGKLPNFSRISHVIRSYVEENHLLGGVYAKISTDDRGIYFFTEGRRPEVKKYIPRSEVDHLSIYTDEEVVFLHNFDILVPPPCLPFKNHFGSIFYIPAGTSYLPDNCASRTKIYNQRSEVDHYSINTNKEMVFYITLIYSPQHYFFWLPKYNETRYCVYCSTWLLQMIQKVTSTRSKV